MKTPSLQKAITDTDPGGWEETTWPDSRVMKALLIFSPPLVSAGWCPAIALLPVLPLISPHVLVSTPHWAAFNFLFYLPFLNLL